MLLEKKMKKNDIFLHFWMKARRYYLSRNRSPSRIEVRPENEDRHICFAPNKKKPEESYYIREGESMMIITPQRSRDELSKIKDGRIILYFDDGSILEFDTYDEFWDTVTGSK